MKRLFLLLTLALSLLTASCAGHGGSSGYSSPYDEDDDIPLIFHQHDRFRSHSHHDYDRDDYHDDDGHRHHGSYRGDWDKD